jgi:hypothetical protein
VIEATSTDSDQQHQWSRESTRAQSYCKSNIVLPVSTSVPTDRARAFSAWPEKRAYSATFDRIHFSLATATFGSGHGRNVEAGRDEAIFPPGASNSSNPSDTSNRISHKGHSSAHPRQGRPSTDRTAGVMQFQQWHISSWEFDLHSAFGNQATTTAALFRDSILTSSRLLELHHCYTSGSATLYPRAPLIPTVHEVMPPSAVAFMKELRHIEPQPWTNTVKATWTMRTTAWQMMHCRTLHWTFRMNVLRCTLVLTAKV